MGKIAIAITLFCSLSFSALAEEKLNADQEKSLTTVMGTLKDISTLPALVDAVRARNQKGANPAADMTNDKWKSLSAVDPLVRSLASNPTAQLLKSKSTKLMSEIFVSAADGTKVAFIEKTTKWTHLGAPKHDVPMTGVMWRGPIEFDESAGMNEIQIALPIIDNGKAIGSIVFGLAVVRL
jgi:hypothetical protein